MEEKTTHEEFVKKLTSALNNCGIEYMLIGGVAAIYYGRPRTTLDCDIVISLQQDGIKDFCACLKKNGFRIREQDILMAFKEKSHFNAYLDNLSVFRADFSWKDSSNLNIQGFAHSKEETLFGVRVRMERPEDIIIAKLVYGSPQDIDDAKAILLRQKQLGKSYLLKRADEEGVRKELEALLKEV